MQLRGYTLTELPNLEVLYLKRWQSNGYYPLEKAIKAEDGKWHVHWLKEFGWSQGFATYTDEGFLFCLRNNSYLVSDSPMSDTKEFNFK